jgi:hypothetical protein
MKDLPSGQTRSKSAVFNVRIRSAPDFSASQDLIKNTSKSRAVRLLEMTELSRDKVPFDTQRSS